MRIVLVLAMWINLTFRIGSWNWWKMFIYTLIIEFPKILMLQELKRDSQIDKEILLREKEGRQPIKIMHIFYLIYHMGLPLVSTQTHNDPIVF